MRRRCIAMSLLCVGLEAHADPLGLLVGGSNEQFMHSIAKAHPREKDLESKNSTELEKVSGSLPPFVRAAEDAFLLEKVAQAGVEIHVNSFEYDHTSPWSAPEHSSGKGSGFVIADNRIMTAAHVIEGASFIEVRKHNLPKPFRAELLHVDHSADLAMLKVSDAKFFEGIEPLEFGSPALVQQEVAAYGYPIGGNALSWTHGMVTRTEMNEYAHSGYSRLSSQTTTPINPGNSGGPVVDRNGRIVGVAFQGSRSLENTAYFIPVPVLEHYLQDVSTPPYGGFPELGIRVQEVNHDHFRACYNLSETDFNGVMIVGVSPRSPAEGILLVGDILISIDGTPMASDGKIALTLGGDQVSRVDWEYAIQRRFVGEKVAFKVLRQGQPISLEVTLQGDPESYEPFQKNCYDAKPRYLVFGGLVFQPLSSETNSEIAEILEGWGDVMGEESLWRGPDSEWVVLTKVLAADLNAGYHSFDSKLIESVDGIAVKNLSHLAEIIARYVDRPARKKKSANRFVEFRFKDGTRVVLSLPEVLKEEAEILELYGISKRSSNDLAHYFASSRKRKRAKS